MEIWVPILVVCIIGLICGVGLSVASSVMAVKEDERFPAIRDCLPGANCGACGFTGCDGYAKALLEPGTKTNLCVPGGAEAAKKLAAVPRLRIRKKLIAPTPTAARIEYAAEWDMVFVPEDTSRRARQTPPASPPASWI